MTDTAVLDGGAPAPAETAGAPIEVTPASHTHPLGSQIPDREPVEQEAKPADKPSESIRDAVRKASDTLKAEPKEGEKPVEKAKPAEPKAEAKPVEKQTEAEKPQQPRAEGGRFASPQPAKADPPAPDSPHREPPARFHAEARAAWETAPEPVRAETHRAIRELEQGIQRYKADAEEYEQIREYRDMAKQYNTTVKNALDNYVGLEKLLHQNPIAGLEKVLSNLNLKTGDGRALTLRDVAAHVLGQKPDELAARQDSTIQELRSKLETLEQKLGGVSKNIEQQTLYSVQSEVDAFRAEKGRERFDELEADITFFLKSGKVPAHLPLKDRLSEAYTLAERLNPAAANAATPPARQAAEPAQLNPAGSKSIAGAPATGSDPDAATKRPSSSIKEALKRASARAS
jgi:hypothetical protein